MRETIEISQPGMGDFGSTLRGLLEARGLSQRRLARLATR